MNKMNSETEITKLSEEAHAYTPGLKVKRTLIIEKTRRLPLKGDVFVKVGDLVDFNTPVAETVIPSDPVVIDAASKLGITPDTLDFYMVKKEGDSVTKDENICGFNAFFGLWKKWLQSPIDGYIERISKISGHIFLREDPIALNIKAYIAGTVIKVIEEEGVVIQTKGALIQGIFGIGGERNGEIIVLAKSPKDHLIPDIITPDCKGKIVVGGSLVTLEAIHRALEVGVIGIVVGGIKEVDLENFLGYEIGVAITGQEDIDLTLVITEGFGEMSMNPRILNLLKEFSGEMAAINGETQIRAGVIRPEIIISHNKSDLIDKEDDLAGGMKTGTSIRIIRDPYFGALGKIISLPVEQQMIETESRVRVLEVEINNKRVIVPRANVEIIEI